MASITQRPSVTLNVTIQLNEGEARAIDALVGYGDDGFIEMLDDAFLKTFYEKLGKSYLQPHEAGLRSFFKSVRQFMPGLLDRTNKAREIFNKEDI